MAAILTIPCVAGCHSDVRTPELTGEWSADAPQYRDRGLRITDDSIILGVGPGLNDAYRLRAVDRTTERDRVRFDITYTNAVGRKHDFRVYYYPAEQVLRLGSRANVVWRQISR